MPCQSDWPDEHYTSISRKEYSAMKKEIDLTTRLLCSTIRKSIREAKQQGIKAADHPVYAAMMANPELKAWWIDHKRVDRERKERELRYAQDELNQARRDIKEAKRKLEKAQTVAANAKKKIGKK
jgi:hypothetical protein